MYDNIPLRSTQKQWSLCINEQYIGKNIYETELQKYVKNTTTKSSYILPDPNVDANSPNYKPMVAEKTTVEKVGDATADDLTYFAVNGIVKYNLGSVLNWNKLQALN